LIRALTMQRSIIPPTVALLVSSVPANDAGNDFLEQFIGDHPPPMPHKTWATRKKARIIMHWARVTVHGLSALRNRATDEPRMKHG